MSGGAIVLDREFLDDLEKEILDWSKSIMNFLTESMIDPKGLTWGDVPLNADERIMKFMNDEAQGVNEQLKLSNPEEYGKRLREFQRDVKQRGLGDI